MKKSSVFIGILYIAAITLATLWIVSRFFPGVRNMVLGTSTPAATS